MSCPDTALVCGTGLNTSTTKPGDPDNNATINAVGIPGAIKVSWTYPTLNPHAVAHVQLYRGITDNFEAATQRGIVGGNNYTDTIPDAEVQTYYYWIKIVSVNGTVGIHIGPASAAPLSRIDDVVDLLSEQIHEGTLAVTLRDKLGAIGSLDNRLTQEIFNRAQNNQAFADFLAAVQDETGATAALIAEEIEQRTAADGAFVNSLNLMAITQNNALAAIGNINDVKIGYSVLKGTDTPYDGDAQTIVYPVAKYPDATFPDYKRNRYKVIDGVGVAEWNALPSKAGKQLEWLKGLPIASAIKQVGVTDEKGDYATLEQAFLAQKALNDKFKAMYTVKLDVNGLVGGFGLYNDGATVEAGFDVDRFWVGKQSTVNGQLVKSYPFIIDGSTVYINGNLRIGTGSLNDLTKVMTFIGSFSSAPSTTGRKKNEVYKNTTDGNSYVLNADGGSWVLFISKGDPGNPGQGQVKGICFLRSSAAQPPSAPTGGSYASPTATGWSDGIPSGTAQLYMSTRIFTTDGLSPQQSGWTTPQAISKDGAVGQGVKVQFSVNGSTLWHDTPSVTDVYMRSGTSTDGGVTWTYAGAVKIQGEQGPPSTVPGPPGPRVAAKIFYNSYAPSGYNYGVTMSGHFSSNTGYSDKLAGDQIEYWISTNPATPNKVFYRAFANSDTWTEAALFVDGNAVITGTLYAKSLVLGDVDTQYLKNNAVSESTFDTGNSRNVTVPAGGAALITSWASYTGTATDTSARLKLYVGGSLVKTVVFSARCGSTINTPGFAMLSYIINNTTSSSATYSVMTVDTTGDVDRVTTVTILKR